MSDLTSPRRVVRFGEYELDLSAGDLHKGGVRLKLRDQSFDVLAILLEKPGQVVTRDELRRRLWPADVFVDFENNLNSAVGRLREALSDSADHPRFIETAPKRGYRFIGSITESGRQRARLIVLPFSNLSGDPAQEYFSDAVTEEIISAIAGLAAERLAVIARTTAMHYKGSRKDIGRIGRELGVEYAVEGSVRRTEDRITVNVQLVQVRDQAHVWTSRFDVEPREILQVERAIAQTIAIQLGIKPQRPVRIPTENFQAYNFYVQGRYYLDKGRPLEHAPQAMHCFEQAIALDPNFALAYDSLAEIYWYLGFFGVMPAVAAASTGVFHAVRALEIDNTLAETHALLAQFRRLLDFNWPEVHREMARALELDPESPTVRLRYAITGLVPEGRIDEAVVQIERALEADPLSLKPRVWLAEALYLGRQYVRAKEQARAVLELDASYSMGYFVLGFVHCAEGNFEEGIAAQRRATELTGGSPVMLGFLGLALAQGRHAVEARAVLEQLSAIAAKGYVPPSCFAWVYLGLGEIDDFFEWMNRAIDAHEHMVIPIKTYPFLDPIRADPRYSELLRKMNLAD